MVSTVSTAGKLLFNIRNIQRQQETSALKTAQYQTGQRHQEISNYGKDLTVILSYRQEIQRSDRLLASSQSVLNTLETTETALNRFEELIDTLRSGIEEGLGFDSNIDPSSYTNWRDANQSQSDDLLREVSDLLNTRVGRRYVFAGTRYTTRPVVQLDQLDSADFYASGSPSVPLTFAQFNPDRTANEIPDYDVNSTANIIPGTPPFTFSVDEDSYKQSRFNTGDTATEEFGVSSNDVTFTRIIYAARNYKQALEEPDQAVRENFLRLALAELETADNGLQILRQREASVIQDVQLLQTRERETVTFRENYLADLVSVDRETVSIEIAALNQQIQASFTLIASQARISLVNYLR